MPLTSWPDQNWYWPETIASEPRDGVAVVEVLFLMSGFHPNYDFVFPR